MPNEDFETSFAVDESSESTLRIEHRHSDGPNREKITAQTVNSTSFSAKLSHVQYGKWHGEDAVLLLLNFTFRFQNESIKRFTDATIRLTLEETKDASLATPNPRNPKNDPSIVFIAPVQICGELKTESKSRDWRLKVPVKYTGAGIDAGVEAQRGGSSDVDVDHMMWLKGFTDSDDRHHADNAVVWDIQENSAQKSGILHRFPAAVVAKMPKEPAYPMKLIVLVTPTMAFTINPIRLFQKRDDGVYLDRYTAKGQPFAEGLDFHDPKFPWDEIVKMPEEYSVSPSARI